MDWWQQIGREAKEVRISHSLILYSVFVSRKKRSKDVINIYLNNRRMEQVKGMKYVGIYFDSRLTLHKHTEHIVEKSRMLIYEARF